MPDRPALRASRLHKVYGSVTALDNVSFTVNRGEIVGLLGPNGAGKTTTINMILGVLAATTGSVEIDGIDIAKHRARALARTNFAAVYAPLPGNLTVSENLRFFGLLYGLGSLRIRVEELLQQFDLAHLRHTKCGLLSSGEQTRAALAKALSIIRNCCCSTSPRRPWIRPRRSSFGRRSGDLPRKTNAASSGPRTI
jgi:ABC-2 type transport system ATP-binding protein